MFASLIPSCSEQGPDQMEENISGTATPENEFGGR